MIDPQALFNSADDVLSAAVSALLPTELANLALSVSVCEPADDCCSIVSAYATNLRLKKVKNQGTRVVCANVALVDIFVVYRDCYPTLDDQGNLPTPDTITNASQHIYENAWTMYRGIYDAAREGTMFTSCPGCRIVQDLTMNCSTDSGACAGYTIKLTIELNT